MKGERGSILGLWTANLPGEFAELVFRPDGEFRLTRCMNSESPRTTGCTPPTCWPRALVSDSRFVDVQTLGLDFYGDTLTIFGGPRPAEHLHGQPRRGRRRDRGVVGGGRRRGADRRAVAGARAVGPRDPNAVQLPTADIPADPNPGRIFDAPTVLTNFQLYRRLIPGFVYFNDQGTIRTVPVVNSREWYFFPTGRVLVRFRNHRAGVAYPTTVVDATDSWGAYRVEPKPISATFCTSTRTTRSSSRPTRVNRSR